MDPFEVFGPQQWMNIHPLCSTQTLQVGCYYTMVTGPWQAPINVSNEKSGILPKFIHFSRPFIHVSRVGSVMRGTTCLRASGV
jgi:hypothetical protein